MPEESDARMERNIHFDMFHSVSLIIGDAESVEWRRSNNTERKNTYIFHFSAFEIGYIVVYSNFQQSSHSL